MKRRPLDKINEDVCRWLTIFEENHWDNKVARCFVRVVDKVMYKLDKPMAKVGLISLEEEGD
jgi:hypothetical protein